MRNVLIIILLVIPSITNDSHLLLLESKFEPVNSKELVIAFIKEHEGYRAYPYTCAANVLTIGYGHTLKKYDTFKYPMNESIASVVLLQDFDRCIDIAHKYTKWNNDSLLAISHFIYSFGSTKFLKSTLYKLIQEGKPIDKEIIKWCNYKKDGTFKYSKHIYNSRLFELKLLQNGIN